MRFIKKHKYKLLTLMLSIVSIFTLFLGINKTYAYESDNFTYTTTLYTDNTYTNELQLSSNNNIENSLLVNNNDIIYFDINNMSNNFNFAGYYFLINFYYFNSNNEITSATNNIVFRFYFGQNNSYGDLTYTPRTIRQFDNYYTAIMQFNSNILYYYDNYSKMQFIGSSQVTNGYIVIKNFDIVKPSDIGLSQYYDTYYGQIEDNYNALLSDYNDLQDNFDTLEGNYNTLLTNFNTLQTNYNNMQLAYNALESDYDTLQANYRTLNNNYADLQTTYIQLQSTYNTLEQNYNDLLESFNDLNSSIDSNIISTLIGDNYFVKTNYQFTNTNSSTESYSNSINNYRWGYVTGTNLNGNTFNIGNALLESLSFVPMYTTSFNDSNFSYLDFSMYYNTPLVLEHYTATGIGSLNTQDNYAWSNGSLISCKYINIVISSSIDLLIQYRVLNQDGTNDTFIVSRDSTSQKYIISFENDDNRVLTNLRIQCKYINNNWVTADSVVCNISNVGDDNYTLGYQNGYNVGISENATNNEVNNKKITELTSRINSLNRTITSLQEQITSFNSDYNLNNLMWTIASTPFESFKQIWNVEFFGVNIASIVTGFLTGIIAIWILKKFFL